MKYVVVLGDGMADYPVPKLSGKTPLEYAKKPNIDNLATAGHIGMVKTIPDGIAPGSDVANLSVMGYDPRVYYTGRSPLEAISMGLDLSDTDVAFRCNLVTLSDDREYEKKTMIDYSSDEISTEEARELIGAVQKHLHTDYIDFHPGISYRHCMVWANGPVALNLTPPHDILEKNINKHLPSGKYGKTILRMMKESYKILSIHPVNKLRIKKGLRPANSIWIWGEGKKPSLTGFPDKYAMNGSVISAVDLIKGLGLCAGLRSVDVEGTTGNIHTNFTGKAVAALRELESGRDFVYIHVEAPDECGHRYEIENKVKAIEYIDEKIIGTLLNGLDQYEDYKIMILPDHPTPLSLRTHTSEPVPYLIYQKSRKLESGATGYTEAEAKKSGVFIEEGHKLMEHFLNI
jgi:2,3-bisphosphoglycerate-independent phosphoglycerate mutase